MTQGMKRLEECGVFQAYKVTTKSDTEGSESYFVVARNIEMAGRIMRKALPDVNTVSIEWLGQGLK